MIYRPKVPISGRGYKCDMNNNAKNYPFYLTSVGRYDCGEGFITLRDGRRDYQLLHTISGEGYYLLNGERMRLQPGSYVLIDCEKSHEYGTVGASWSYNYLHFAGFGMNPYREKLMGDACIIYPREAALLNVYMNYLSTRPPIMNDAECAHACAIIALCLSAVMSGTSARAESENTLRHDISVVEPAVHYIRLHFAERMSLDDLLNVTYLSRYYFCRKFKSVTGYSPYQYITRARMEKARELLLTTQKSISAISKQTGYSGSGQFIRQFVKYAGVTPDSLRSNRGNA